MQGSALLWSIFVLIYGGAGGTEYAPSLFLRFENASDVGEDSSGNERHLKLPKPKTGESPPQQEETGGPVGGNLCFGSDLESPGNAAQPLTWHLHTTSNIPAAPGLTVEFLLKPNPGFLRGGEAVPLTGLTLQTQSMSWEVATDLGSRELVIPLDGAGPEAADYLWGSAGDYDGWHHLALVFDAKTGRMELWLDGISTPTMQKIVNASRTVSAVSEFMIDSRNPVRLSACMDEIAVFSSALPASVIYQHFEDTLKQHRKYDLTMGSPQPTPPAPPVYPAVNSSDYFDAKEFAPGTQLPSPDGLNNTVESADSCVTQLHVTAAPRFNTSSTTKYYTPFNFNWMDPHYMAGATDPRYRLNNTNMTLDLQHTMAKKWRYGPMLWGLRVGSEDEPPVQTAGDNLTIAMANGHPEWPLNVIAPFGHVFRNQSAPDGCYLQNHQGQFITVTGEVVPAGGKKSIRPMSVELAKAEGCPDSIWATEGENIRDFGFRPLAKLLTRPLHIINLDGEVFVDVDTPAEDYNFARDPKVYADFNASGLPNWLTYWSTWRVRLTKAATDPYMTDDTLRSGILKGTFLTMYQVQGTDNYFGNWSQTREIGSPMPSGLNRNAAMRYSTTDMYLDSPHMWWECGGSDHAVCWVDMSRQSELAEGDFLFSPFVAAGWSGKAEKNTRPPQWLGLLKLLAAWGAEWFYAGFFNVHVDSHGQMPPSSEWCWQGMMPSYAQAVTSHVAPFLYEGSLVYVDGNTTFAMKTDAKSDHRSPLLWAGQPNILAIARHWDDAFLLSLATQRNSNAALNLGNKSASAMIHVPGIYNVTGEALQLTARIQGSVYVYRNDTSGSSEPVVYQVDGWHEATHPAYWTAASGPIVIEAELFSGHLSQDGAALLRTHRVEGSSRLDFRGARTCVDLQYAAEVSRFRVHYPLLEHGLGDLVARTVRVRVLLRHAESQSIANDVRVNGQKVLPEGSETSSPASWAWHAATVNTGFDTALVLSGSACIDQIAIQL
eukprot:COSAG02_NODE_5344_length_4414_cov_5.903824_1_plen_998_part_00